MALPTNLSVLLLVWVLCSITLLSAQPQSIDLGSARELDGLLQEYAFQAFTRPRTVRTGVVYDGEVPSNLTGVLVSGLRLRSGSLWTRGFSAYREFEIPMGVTEQPYVERLVLVYQNLGNWSMRYYPLEGYTYLAPVLGLLAYDASNLMAVNLPELDIRASGDPISIRFPRFTVPDGSVPRCVLIGLNGSVVFSNVMSDNVCTTFQQGHFAIVIESIAPSPSPVSPVPLAPPPPLRSGPTSSGGNHGGVHGSRVWIIVGSVLGGFVLLVLLGLFAMWVRKYKSKKEMQQMEKAADVGEALHMKNVGNTRAPSATGTRTQPALETEYVP